MTTEPAAGPVTGQAPAGRTGPATRRTRAVVLAAVLALGGKKNLQKVGPPERTLETVKDDLAWAKHPTQVPARRV